MNYKCDNCGHVCDEDDAVLAPDLFERLDPGGVFTEYECPKCGALTYPTEGYVVELERKIQRLEAEIEAAAEDAAGEDL